MAWRNGARLVIVNDGATELDQAAEVVVSGRAGEVVPRIVEELTGAT
jgi:NAD-dependent SIR2 family protein deacetylase